jgi:hypothetical protein
MESKQAGHTSSLDWLQGRERMSAARLIK